MGTGRDVDTSVPRVPWSYLFDNLVWNQGEHLTIVGPTGSGKSVLWKLLVLIRLWAGGWTVIFATKTRDDELTELETEEGWELARTAKQARNFTDEAPEKVLFWPDKKGLVDKLNQRQQFARACELIYQHGNWCIVMDELRYLTRTLHLTDEIETLYLQGRSNGVTLLGISQRPRFVPLETFSQTTHFFFFRCADEYDLKRLSGIGGANSAKIKQAVAGLAKYDFLYVNAITGFMCISRVEL